MKLVILHIVGSRRPTASSPSHRSLLSTVFNDALGYVFSNRSLRWSCRHHCPSTVLGFPRFEKEPSVFEPPPQPSPVTPLCSLPQSFVPLQQTPFMLCVGQDPSQIPWHEKCGSPRQLEPPSATNPELSPRPEIRLSCKPRAGKHSFGDLNFRKGQFPGHPTL